MSTSAVMAPSSTSTLAHWAARASYQRAGLSISRRPLRALAQDQESGCTGGAAARRRGLELVTDWSDEETGDPLIADRRNFYKVEKRTQDGMKVDSLLYAGNNLGKAQEIFANAIEHRPPIRITIRQRTRVLQRWPQQKWRG